MHTIMVIAGGFVLLGLFVVAARHFSGTTRSADANAAKSFIPVWLAAALINMWVGVSRAGYTVVQETPIALVVFAVPTGAALFIWWRSARDQASG